MNLDRVSLGLPGATEPGVIATVARHAEAAGFRALWLNDTPTGDALEGLAAAAASTSTLGLATGVIPLDRRPAATLIAPLRALPLDRVTLGIGSGAGRSGVLDRVRAGVEELRAAIEIPIVVGALGPAMRELAARTADGALLSWLRPQDARTAMAELRRDAAGRSVRGVLYVRATVSADARETLEREAAQYASYPNYAAHFARTGATAIETTIDGAADLAAQVESYTDEVDDVVLRAITAGSTERELLAFIDEVARA